MSAAVLGLALTAVLGYVAAQRAALLATRRRVADAVHEVSGPLTAAGLALEAAARRGAIAPDRAAGIEAQLLRARRAVEDLAGAATAARRACDRLEALSAQELLGRAVAGWEPAAAAAGRELRVVGGSSAHVVADPVRVAQAVGNLVANALEHGDGAVDVRLHDRAGRVRIEVRDRGAGLGEPLPALRKRAVAAGSARGRGLAIASAIAERHGGRLVAAPSPAGAAIALELPALPDARDVAR